MVGFGVWGFDVWLSCVLGFALVVGLGFLVGFCVMCLVFDDE